MAAKTVENGEKFPKNKNKFPFLGEFFFRMYQSILSMYARFQGFFVVKEGSNLFLNIVI